MKRHQSSQICVKFRMVSTQNFDSNTVSKIKIPFDTSIGDTVEPFDIDPTQTHEMAPVQIS